MEVVIMLLFDFNLDFSIVSPDFGGRSSWNAARYVLSNPKSFELLKTYLAVFRRTQIQSSYSWFVIGGYHSIGKQYGGLSSLWAIRL